MRHPSDPGANLNDLDDLRDGSRGATLSTVRLPDAPAPPPCLETLPLPQGQGPFPTPILPFQAPAAFETRLLTPMPPPVPFAVPRAAAKLGPAGRSVPLASCLAVGLTAFLFGLGAAILVWWGMRS